MKILVFGRKLNLGGTEVNTLDLTASLRDFHGHDVVLFATPGPMLEVVKEKGLRFLPAPDANRHPSLDRMKALHDVVQRERPDLIHVWEWVQCLDAFYLIQFFHHIPMVVTEMSMEVMRLLPKAVPTTFGTPELVDQARYSGRGPLELIVPPVDVQMNAPDSVDPNIFRQRYKIRDSDITLVTVSRLEYWLKGESLLHTIHAVRSLGKELPVRLLIVGDGSARAEIELLAREVNAELGRSAVVLTGALLDPRPAYAAADIVIGMGGSALRGMAFGKPVIIVGEQGFSAPLTPETADSFYYKGIYGLGNGNLGIERLAANIKALAEYPDQLISLGQFSRKFILQHFALESVSNRLDKFLYASVNKTLPAHVTIADGLRTAGIVIGRKFEPRCLRQLRKSYEMKKQQR
jgi:glycosyltransferase involved in cell wall biosynthesis